LLGVQTKRFNFHHTIITPQKGGVLDPDRFARLVARYENSMLATERDIDTILFSSKDHVHGGLRRNLVCVDSDGRVERELVHDLKVFNPRYRGIATLSELLSELSTSQTRSRGGTTTTTTSSTMMTRRTKLRCRYWR
jgi:hypothetical protein